MKVRLTRDAKILHRAGEIVEVSPAEAGFLTSVGSAVRTPDAVKPDAPDKPKRTKKKD